MKHNLITKIVVGFILAMFLSTSGLAQTAAPAAPVVQKSFYERLKAKAITYYHQYYDRFFGNKAATKPTTAAQNSVADQRLPASEAPVTPVADPAKLATLPSYQTQGLDQQNQAIQQIQQSVSQQKAFEVKGGTAADASLKKTKSGVAVFDFKKKVKEIPLLNIGVESQISQSKFQFELPKVFTLQFQKIQELASPELSKASEVESLVKEKFDIAQKPERFEEIHLSFPKEITAENINKIQLTIGQDATVQLVPFVEISEKEMDLLKGLIFAEYQDRCHVATGFLKKLNDLTGKEKDLRDYYYGSCQFKMGFFTQGVPRLLEVVDRNVQPFSKNAVDLLLSDVHREYVEDMMQAFIKVKPENIPEKKLNEFNYYVALGLAMKGEHKTAVSYALKVKPDSKKYLEAQYIASVSEYLAGDVKSSLDRQEKLLREIGSGGAGPLKSLVSMNMGRAAYRNKKYKEAIEAYKFIGRENSLWIQSLTEQGWMQILASDAPGAIGNMHSIQVPQFKDIYKPDSYVVRAIGYLNICQYGDAKKSLDHLARIYFPWLQNMKQELKKDQFNYVFYQNVIDALRSPNNKTALSQPILREISRHKDFLNIQEAINNKVDEEGQFGFINGLISKDLAKAKSKMAMAKSKAKDLENKIKSASAAKDTLKFVNQWKSEKKFESDTADYYAFEIQTIEESQVGFKKFQADGLKKIDEIKQSMKSAAGKAMKTRLAKMEKKLEKLMENNEFLTYEIFSGSGENIRYISSGGNVKGTQSTRETASAQAPAGKVFLWDFDGEFWADEVGNYKSSLKDNCPNANNLTKKVE